MDGTWLRLGVFAGLFAMLACAETFAPARTRTARRTQRWPTHFLLLLISNLLVRAAAPLGVVGVALWAEAQQWGLFNLVAAPHWLAAICSVVLLDFSLYLQHRALHAVPFLWRMHAPHHADTDLDASSGIRFHPLEMMLSALWKSLVVVALGAPAAIVLAFEIALNSFSLFTHANVRLPGWIEQRFGLVFITPAQHRLHHDRDCSEKPPNFGFSVTLWDQLFRTWRRDGAPAHLGLPDITPLEAASFEAMGRLPFRMRRT